MLKFASGESTKKSTLSSYHLAVEALLSKLLLIAGQTVVVGVL